LLIFDAISGLPPSSKTKPETEANTYDTPPTVDVFMVHNAPPGIEFALLSEAIASPTQMGKKPPSIPAVERWRQCQG
jgi:hypothetical protein